MKNNLLQSKGIEFAQKVRWRMRHDRNPLLVTLQDKYRVRDCAASKQIDTPGLLHVTDEPESIPFDQFPSNYFIKANHGWRWNILCFDSRFYRFGNGIDLVNPDGSFINLEAAPEHEMSQLQVVQQCQEWLSCKHRSDEWAYSQIPPVILAETLIAPKKGDDLKDYRMYVFYGKVRAISIGSAIYRKEKENVFFDPDWTPIPLTQYKEKLPAILPEKPECLDEMIRAAESLGADIDFVRVDLYDAAEGVMLGEMTIYPDAGNPGTPTTCPVFNTWLGDQWVS